MSDTWHPDSFGYDALPPRATNWRLRSRTLELGGLPRWMGIVNVTPDSFSDGGRYLAVDAAVEHALALVDQGAHLLDIGGESTRPYATPVDADEELRRVVPVIERLASRVNVPISIDTSKAIVARAAIDAGAEVINDVTGLTADPEMMSVAVASGAGICAMHMQGTPKTMQDDPRYENIVNEIHDYLRQRRDALIAAGIAVERICLDPGIGFGKSHEHNFELMANCWQFHDLGCPLLVGHSRKGFLAKLLGSSEAGRNSISAGAAVALALQGVQVIRVHDVASARETVLGCAGFGGMGRNWRG
jgi:dihydropteroate synthase